MSLTARMLLRARPRVDLVDVVARSSFSYGCQLQIRFLSSPSPVAGAALQTDTATSTTNAVQQGSRNSDRVRLYADRGGYKDRSQSVGLLTEPVPFRRTSKSSGLSISNKKHTALGTRDGSKSRARGYDQASSELATKEADSRGPLLKDVLAIAIKAGNYKELEAECDRRLVSGERLDRRLVTTLIRSFGSSGNIEKAIALFENIGASPELRNVQLDAHHYSCAIAACTNTSQLDTALELLRRSKTDDRVFPNPNRYIYSAAMNACINAGKHATALEIFEDFQTIATEKGTKIDSTLCNTALKAYAKLGDHAKALILFSRMKSSNINRDIISFIAVLSSCSKAGDWQEAQNLFEEIDNSKWLKPTLEIYTLVISACIRGDNIDLAMQYFKMLCAESDSHQTSLSSDMENDDIDDIESERRKKDIVVSPPDACLLNIFIPGVAPKHTLLAVKLYEEMVAAKMIPTLATCNSIITALETSGNGAKALSLFYDAARMGVYRRSRRDADVTNAPIDTSLARINLGDVDASFIVTRLRGAIAYYKKTVGEARDKKLPDLLLIIGEDAEKTSAVKAFLVKHSIQHLGTDQALRIRGIGAIRAKLT